MYYIWEHKAYPGHEFITFEGIIKNIEEDHIVLAEAEITYRYNRFMIGYAAAKGDIVIECQRRHDIIEGEIAVLNMMHKYPQLKSEINERAELQARKAIEYQEYLKKKTDENRKEPPTVSPDVS